MGPGNAVQAKTGSATAVDTISVALDAPTGDGGSVIVEMFGPIVWPGMPEGFDFDFAYPASAPVLWVFRKSPTVAGESSWSWTNTIGGTPTATNWLWRVTEWDAGLDPVSGFEGSSGGNASGTGVTTLSTGTSAPETRRSGSVALATHLWQLPGTNSAQTFDWSSHTNGFTERDELRVTLGTSELDASFSWAFGDTVALNYEVTATVNTTPRRAGDTYYAILAVYGASVLTDPPITV